VKRATIANRAPSPLGALLDRADLLELSVTWPNENFDCSASMIRRLSSESHMRASAFSARCRPHSGSVGGRRWRPISCRHAHTLPLQHVDDDGIALGPEVAAVLVALPDFERYGADPVEEGGVVERSGTVGAVVSRPASR